MAARAMNRGTDWIRSLADAKPLSFWLDDPGRPDGPAGADRRRTLRPAGRRRRLQRPVDRAARQGARPRARCGPARRAGGRLGGLRPQRRLLRRLPHPRRRERTGPLARRDRRSWRSSATATSTRSRTRSPATPSTATSSAPARSTWPPSRTRSTELQEFHQELTEAGLAGGTELLDARRDPRTRSTRRPSSAACTTGAVSRCCIPPSSPGASSRPASSLGVRIHEHTPALELSSSGAGTAVRTPYGRVFARHVALGTNVFPSLVKRVRPYTVPVYDYALMTEPLTDEQLASIGWKNRQGLGDSRQPVPLLPADRGQPDPVGRLRRDLPLRRPGARRVRPQARDVPRSSPASSSPASRSWRGCASATPGAAPSTPAPASRRSSARPTAAASRTPPDTPASASARPASARR